MKNILITSAFALAVCVAVVASQTAAAPQDEPVPGAATGGLSELSAMTFSCPRAGLNAAAGQAARVPSQGTYQFAYFKIINDGHHAAYEVHFRSNYEGEKDLKYCVEMYCQQGWDPKTTKTSVTLMSAQRAGVNAHGAACGAHQMPASRGVK
jgi:hypothetical protein